MEKIVQTFSVLAAVEQFKAVKPTGTDGQCAVGTANALCFGITGAPTTAADEDVPVIMFGPAEAKLGDTVNQGDPLKSDANGDLVPATTDADKVIAIALQDGVDNDIARVFVLHTVVNAASAVITDPGDAQAIAVTQSGHVEIVSTTIGGETRTIAAPLAIGQRMLISFKTDGGTVVIAVATTVNVTGNNRITLDDAGDSLELVAIASGSNIRWRVVYNDGATLATA